MKKFYKKAECIKGGQGWIVALDGKPLQTPLKNRLLSESKDLILAIAAEWNAQGDDIVPETMPLTQLLNTSIDKSMVAETRSKLEEEILSHLDADTIFFYAHDPKDLIEAQKKQWSPVQRYIEVSWNVSLIVTSSLTISKQPAHYKVRATKYLEDLSPHDFTVFQTIVGIVESFALTVAFMDGKLTLEGMFDAAFVEEIFQNSLWGSDDKTVERREGLKAELEHASAYLNYTR